MARMWLHLNTGSPNRWSVDDLTNTLTQIVIRYSRQDDERALTRLAGRDTKRVPEGKLLVAESEGEIRAAVQLSGGGSIADPFHRTANLLKLLELRRRQLRVGRLARR
jgi:hypothetical protein